MKTWIQLAILGATIGVAKSASFIKVVVLAGLGLAGLWMLHTLAQDFSSLTQNGFGSAGGGGGGANHESGGSLFKEQDIKVFKRSINDIEPKINWELIIKRDPASCARSFICQLEASNANTLIYEEEMILNMTRVVADDNSWAGLQLKEALENGQSATNPVQCMKMYRYCPYTKRMMLALLRLFGNR